MTRLQDAARADALFRAIEKFAPILSANIRGAWENGALHVELDVIARLLVEGRVEEVIEYVMKGADAVFTARAGAPMRDLFTAAASHVWTRDLPRMPLTRAIQVAFDGTNDRTLLAMKANTLRMVREVTETTKEGLREYLTDGLQRGVNPREVARSIRNDPVFGLTGEQEKTIQRYREFLTTVHERRSVKQMGLGLRRSLEVDRAGKPIDGIMQWRLRDLRYDRSIKRALESNQPLTPRQIEDQINAYRRGFRRFRSENIARTEMVTAGAKGSKAAWWQMVDNGLFRVNEIARYWFVAPSQERVCPRCRPIPRLNAGGRGLDEPFIGPAGEPIDDPPAHTGCRCVVFIQRRGTQ